MEIDTDKYVGAWYDTQNVYVRIDLREQLDAGAAVRVDFQPGDGTRYEFMLMRQGELNTVCGSGIRPLRVTNDGDILYATILNGLGTGVGTFNRQYSDGDRDYIMAMIRHRISEKMEVGNPHTVEALAATIFTLWYMDD